MVQEDLRLEMALLPEQAVQGTACWIWGATDIDTLKCKRLLLSFFSPTAEDL